MLPDSIRSIFRTKDEARTPEETETPAPEPTVDPVSLAACVLLLDLAHADGVFADPERAHLEGVLERHFCLPPEAGRLLLEAAENERGNSVDYFRFTSELRQSYDVGQKMVLAEVMWGMVLADGEITEHEQYLTRKISNLLGLQPGYLAAAKAAAANRNP